MALILSEDQLILKETAKTFLDDKSPISRMRELRDSEDANGFSRDLWKEMAEMGWTGIPFPEEYGGAGMGHAELGVVLEECGRVLAPEPFLSTVLLGGNAILLGGSDTQKKELLTGICNGDTIVAVALQDKGRFDPYLLSATASKAGDGYTLDGEYQYVLDAHVADQLIAVARTSGTAGEKAGLSLFLVDPKASGVSISRNLMMDGRNSGDVTLSGVSVAKDQVLGKVDQGAEILEAVLDRAAIVLSAEMFGTMEETFERTLAYVKEREQFGVKIGTFQALRHRVADLFCDLELTRSVVREALSALDAGRDDVSQLASAAKARASDIGNQIAKEALQMHGGIGMTDEEEIGLFFKRAKAAELTLGDALYHKDRYATLRGF
jgi:alkylation response protein AidB-like acyl-CoA dehydrogenase